jgi:hypothetical protein
MISAALSRHDDLASEKGYPAAQHNGPQWKESHDQWSLKGNRTQKQRTSAIWVLNRSSGNGGFRMRSQIATSYEAIDPMNSCPQADTAIATNRKEIRYAY